MAIVIAGNDAMKPVTNSGSSFQPIYVPPAYDIISARNDSVDDNSSTPAETQQSNLTSARSSPTETNVIDEGVSKLAGIYQECSQKIDKRIEKLLSWKMTKTNTENDLIQLKEYVLLLYRCLKIQSFR